MPKLHASRFVDIAIVEFVVRLLLIGDIVGKPGRDITTKAVSVLKESKGLDLVVANAENSAGGSGITPEIYDELTCAGVDAITLGDHIYRRREIYDVLEQKKNIVKPAPLQLFSLSIRVQLIVFCI